MQPGETDGAVRNDSALMRRIASGDAEAYRQVIAGQSPRLVRIAFGILGNLDEAEDATQEALLALWQAAPDWQEKATIAAYLRTVATRKAIDILRRRKGRVDDFNWEGLEDTARNPQEMLENRDDMEHVLKHMTELPERQRIALVLTQIEELSHQQAADAMDIDVEALSSLLARARRTLRRRLQGEETGD